MTKILIADEEMLEREQLETLLELQLLKMYTILILPIMK